MRAACGHDNPDGTAYCHVCGRNLLYNPDLGLLPPPPIPTTYPTPPAPHREVTGAAKRARTSLIVGIVSFFCCGIILGPAAIYEGVKARKEMRLWETNEGEGMAIAGIVCGALAIPLFILSSIFLVGTSESPESTRGQPFDASEFPELTLPSDEELGERLRPPGSPTPETTGAVEVEELWRTEIEGTTPDWGTPAIAQGVLVVVTDDHVARGLDATSGVLLWTSVSLGDTADIDAVASEGLVFVALRSGEVVALDPTSGAERWRANPGPVAQMVPVEGGVAVSGESVSVLDAATGVTRWSGLAGSYLALDASSQTLVVVSHTALSAVDPATGDVAWTRSFEELRYGVIAADGVAYLLLDEERLLRVDVADGSTVGEVALEEPFSRPCNNPAAVVGDALFFLGVEQSCVRNKDSGVLVGGVEDFGETIRAGGTGLGHLVVNSDHLWVLSPDGGVAAYEDFGIEWSAAGAPYVEGNRAYFVVWSSEGAFEQTSTTNVIAVEFR